MIDPLKWIQCTIGCAINLNVCLWNFLELIPQLFSHPWLVDSVDINFYFNTSHSVFFFLNCYGGFNGMPPLQSRAFEFLAPS